MISIQDRICKYIKTYLNCGFDVSPDHFLSADLGIYGTDGIYFIQDFGKEFATDFSELNITQHFSCEHVSSTLLRYFRYAIGFEKTLKRQFIDLRVSDLIAAVKRNRWSSQILDYRSQQ